MTYDYLVVGAGLFGATFAYEAAKRGKLVKVIEKRSHIAGNIYTKKSMASRYMNMVPTFSILPTRPCGNTLNNFRSSTVSTPY